ncbi:T9SS C-terminal target domain-containing protein [candidate division KSB1 bacterium]|nr:polysaccharide deacetylase family protein [candidate division KSB1 bacterium]RQW05420.1 MAG: T9SS C-terminal target domain-containing protein [candidate division KSB1 bacterium]
MKTAMTISEILIYIFIVFKSYAQTIDAPYEVGTWYDFRNAAVSFTFDDGSPNQYSKAIPIFNEFDLILTLFIVTGETFAWPANWEALKQAASEGHEIASHTVTHTSFADLNDSLETIELRESREKIESFITGQKCITMAYPYCVTGNKSILSDYYLAARICSGTIEPKTPRDFMAISSIICGTEGSVKTAENFLTRASSAIRSNGWCVFLLHGIDNDGGWSPVTLTTLRETVQLFKENSHDYWVETFGNVVRYIKERDNASIMENNIQYVQFDAIPDNGEIILSREKTTNVQNKNKQVFNFSLAQNFPNPFNSQTTIRFSIPSSEFVSIQLFDVNGKLVRTLMNQNLQAGNHSIVLDAEGLASGTYHYIMQAGSFKQTKRLLLLK